jgi:hypothetical protein
MTKYHLESGGPSGDQLQILRFAYLVWRIGANGQPEAHGVFADEASAKADPIGSLPQIGWRIERVPLIAWNALVLKGG